MDALKTIDDNVNQLIKDRYLKSPALSIIRGNLNTFKTLKLIDSYDVCETKNKIMFVITIGNTTHTRAIIYDGYDPIKYLKDQDCYNTSNKKDVIKAYDRAMKGV